MKTLSMFLMLLGLGVFAVGCGAGADTAVDDAPSAATEPAGDAADAGHGHDHGDDDHAEEAHSESAEPGGDGVDAAEPAGESTEN